MNIGILIIAVFSIVIAIYSYELRKKGTKLKSQLEKTEQMLNDSITAKARLIAIEKVHNHFSVNGGGAWEVRRYHDGVFVGKFSNDGFPAVLVRWFPYDLPMSQDDIDYKYNCAIELLEKLTEEV